MSRGTKVGKYRSKLEQRVAEQLNKASVQYAYEDKEYKIDYSVPATKRSYLPDFIIRTKHGRDIYVEAKGIWDYDDRYKHYLIRVQRPELDIRFVFQRANQRIRKGSKTTYRDICEGRGTRLFKGIEWQYGDGGLVPEGWLNE